MCRWNRIRSHNSPTVDSNFRLQFQPLSTWKLSTQKRRELFGPVEWSRWLCSSPFALHNLQYQVHVLYATSILWQVVINAERYGDTMKKTWELWLAILVYNCSGYGVPENKTGIAITPFWNIKALYWLTPDLVFSCLCNFLLNCINFS
jgi:hypothetical protein